MLQGWIALRRHNTTHNGTWGYGCYCCLLGYSRRCLVASMFCRFYVLTWNLQKQLLQYLRIEGCHQSKISIINKIIIYVLRRVFRDKIQRFHACLESCVSHFPYLWLAGAYYSTCIWLTMTFWAPFIVLDELVLAWPPSDPIHDCQPHFTVRLHPNCTHANSLFITLNLRRKEHWYFHSLFEKRNNDSLKIIFRRVIAYQFTACLNFCLFISIPSLACIKPYSFSSNACMNQVSFHMQATHGHSSQARKIK